jgi:hypothetical protein
VAAFVRCHECRGIAWAGSRDPEQPLPQLQKSAADAL